ncbi:MAG: glycosyl hydrolase family 18 protein [bacterium]|nr:glycosyl hydrolase family 18 protein [bacterium]
MKLSSYIFLVLLMCAPISVSAATSFEVTGWMPYWRSSSSTKDVLPHLDLLTEVNPFVYTLKNDGTIVDNGKLTEEPWKSFILAAKAKKVRVIPTIMSGSGETLHRLLSNRTSRIALEDAIAALVKENNFDGIDIDFEGKKAETKDYFSLFLKGLYLRMGNKWVMCTIESRTPLDSRYYGADIPKDATIYANDFKEINKYCDRVRIMAYDQQGIDQSLAAAAETNSEVYAPLADPRWVRKTVEVASKDIAKSKILIGIPTYGYEYEVTAYANNQYMYKILWTFNPGWAYQIMAKYGVDSVRNSAGERHFTYTHNPSEDQLLPRAIMPNSAMSAANAASMIATAGNTNLKFRLVDWPDAQSIAGKIELAQILGVRGVSIFKMDGGEDQGMWKILEGVKGSASFADAPTPALANPLTRSLGLGARHIEVRSLQVILNSDPDTAVADSGAGSIGSETTTFGPATERAVKKFQVKYGIAKAGGSGYGYVGPATRAKLNTILETL